MTTLSLDDARIAFEALDKAAKRHDAQACAVQTRGHSWQHHVERAAKMRDLRDRIARETMAELALPSEQS